MQVAFFFKPEKQVGVGGYYAEAEQRKMAFYNSNIRFGVQTRRQPSASATGKVGFQPHTGPRELAGQQPTLFIPINPLLRIRAKNHNQMEHIRVSLFKPLNYDHNNHLLY